jgi:chitin disaccharide deacetylase
MNIVINADDFGYSDGVCNSIIELFEANAISSTTVMAAADGASLRLSEWPTQRLLGRAGVHLQLTSGTPLAPAEQIPSLVDPSNGKFLDPRKGGKPNPQEVELEWRYQIEATQRALGGPVTHLDSHHGMHRMPELFEVYLKLARELGVPIRGAQGEIGQRMRRDHIAGSTTLVRDWTGTGLGATDLQEKVKQAIQANPEDVAIEVIVHPGYNDPYLAAHSSLAEGREWDHSGLLELAQEGWPESEGYSLAPFSIFGRSTRRGASAQ